MATTAFSAHQIKVWNGWVANTFTVPTAVTWQDETWYQWNTPSTSTTTASYIIQTQAKIWRAWTSATANTFTLQDETWYMWNRTPWTTPARPIETPEERQAREDRAQRAREEASRRALAEKRRIQGAQDRALELLEMLLTPAEKEIRDREGEIWVRGSEGGLYVIELRESVHGNIRHIDEHGCMLGRLCVQPHMTEYQDGRHVALPLADGWVGQYLAIKNNEEELRRTANWSGRRVCQQPNVPILKREAA